MQNIASNVIIDVEVWYRNQGEVKGHPQFVLNTWALHLCDWWANERCLSIWKEASDGCLCVPRWNIGTGVGFSCCCFSGLSLQCRCGRGWLPCQDNIGMPKNVYRVEISCWNYVYVSFTSESPKTKYLYTAVLKSTDHEICCFCYLYKQYVQSYWGVFLYIYWNVRLHRSLLFTSHQTLKPLSEKSVCGLHVRSWKQFFSWNCLLHSLSE